MSCFISGLLQVGLFSFFHLSPHQYQSIFRISISRSFCTFYSADEDMWQNISRPSFGDDISLFFTSHSAAKVILLEMQPNQCDLHELDEIQPNVTYMNLMKYSLVTYMNLMKYRLVTYMSLMWPPWPAAMWPWTWWKAALLMGPKHIWWNAA